MSPSMGIGPNAPPSRPTFSNTYQYYRRLGLEIVTELANTIGGEYAEMANEGALSLLERLGLLFSKVLELLVMLFDHPVPTS